MENLKLKNRIFFPCGFAKGVVALLQGVSLHHCKECRCTTARGVVAKLFIFLLIATAGAGLTAQTVITHDIATGILTIAGNSTDNYIITGTDTTNYVEVQTGYKGRITLRNLNITLSGNNPHGSQGSYATPFTVRGQDYCSNLTPVTNVDIILEGNNVLCYKGIRSSPAFQVDQGAQINISENPCGGGTLSAIVTEGDGNGGGGAAIGAREDISLGNQAIDTGTATGNCSGRYTPPYIAGGNIVISSGTITAQGGHGAGIGGGHWTYYDGMIVVYGGTVNASTLYHSAGLGSGCPNGRGVESACYMPNSAIIVIPPAQISATGADNVKGTPVASLALAGTHYIVYIGDTAKPLITIRTDDFEPYADIHADLSQNPDIARVINTVIAQNRLDIKKVNLGQTDASGLFQFHATFNNNTTFFTDATSSQPSTLGRPYLSETVQLSSGGTIILKRVPMNIAIFPVPSLPLAEGYAAAQSLANAFRIKIIYSDIVPMTNFAFDMAGGATSDFPASGIRFYASNGTTPIAPPTTLSRGDTIYAVIPLKIGKLEGYYTDVFRFTGNWNGSSAGYIRQTAGQNVYHVDTVKHICKGDSVLFNRQYYKEAGFYADTLQNVNGCDSIITMHLIIDFYDLDIYNTVCNGDSILFGKKYYKQAGVYTDSLKTIITGCDSIVTLHLEKAFPKDTAVYDTICRGDSLLFGEKYYKQAGTYADKLKTISGCDSIVTLRLYVASPKYTNIHDTICSNDSILFGGKYYRKTGVYIDSLQTVLGCDSVVRLYLLVKLSSETIFYDTVCTAVLPYRGHGFYAPAAGDYVRVRKNKVGCDSIITLHLTVLDTLTQEIAATICDGETYLENGFTETQTGIYTRMGKNSDGCNVLVRLDLTVNPTPIADFEAVPPEAMFEKEIQFIDKTTLKYGSLTAWLWNFGDGENSSQQHPTHAYSVLGYVTVSLWVENEFGCKDSIAHDVLILKALNFPNIYTPIGGDGRRYVFRPLENCGVFEDFSITIYNRWGMEVWKKSCKGENCPDYDDSFWWNGTTQWGEQAVSGVYYWVVYAHYPSSNLKPLIKNGSVTVIGK